MAIEIAIEFTGLSTGLNLSNMTQLEYLGLEGVVMEGGPIPSYLFNFHQLSGLILIGANFTSTIPTEFFDSTLFPTLTYIDLSFNSLVGTIPTQYSTSGVMSLFLIDDDLCMMCTIPSPRKVMPPLNMMNWSSVILH
jgi:hypothetical protein